MQDKITLTIGRQKNIALIAHDSKKKELIAWCDEHQEILKQHFLNGTGTTAKMITEATGLPVRGYNSGPLGGDQQIGAKIANNKATADFMITSSFMTEEYDHDVINFSKNINERAQKLL